MTCLGEEWVTCVEVGLSPENGYGPLLKSQPICSLPVQARLQAMAASLEERERLYKDIESRLGGHHGEQDEHVQVWGGEAGM